MKHRRAPGWRAPLQRCRRESEAGQTATEMLMMMGLLTAMLISATGIIVPTMRWVVERLVRHMVLFVSSP